MKNLKLLKNLITIYYYGILVIFGIGVIAIPMLLAIGEKTEITFLDQVIDLQEITPIKMSILLVLIGSLYLLYFLSIRLVKQTVDILATGTYFTIEIITNFKRIGQYFLGIGIGATVVKAIIGLITRSTIHMKIGGSMLVFILFGLFFMFLSEAFAKAKSLREENSLTI